MAEYNVDRVTYGPNTYIFNDKAARNAILDIIADNGKNLIPDVSYGRPKGDPCPYVDIPIRATAGSYMLSIDEVTSDDVDADTCLVTVFSNGSIADEVYLERGSNITAAISIYSPADTIRIYASDTASHSSGDKIYVLRPMLCPRSYYNVDETYAFYTPGNRELDAREQIDRDRLIELLDNGPKNLVNYTRETYTHRNTTFTNNGDGTCTVTTNGASQQYHAYRIMGDPDSTGWQYGVPIPKGSYILTGLPSGAASNTYRYILGITTSSSATRSSTSIYDDGYEFEVTNDTTRIDLSVYTSTGVNLPSPGVTYRPMISRLKDYKLSPTFQPYRPSYQELYNRVEALENTSTELIDSGPKNIVNWSANSTTISGVTFTVNSDKTVSTSGTASARAQLFCTFTVPASLKAGRYVLSGCPPGGGNASGATTLYALYIGDVTVNARVVPNNQDDNGNALEFDWTPESTHTYSISIDIRKGTNATGLVFKPMICPIEYWKATKAYQPYRPSYQQLYDMVKALQNGS